MTTINENKFYQALESIFTGANIEGDSGYVNLLKIKSSYYKLILEEFKKSVNNEQIITDSFKEEFFDKLYSFFEKYFSESGSVYFVKTANWQRVYEQVYTDNKDVVLFWKTHMLYYVKSDILFQSIDVHITDEESKQDYHFFFDVGNLQAKQNNEKKALIFSFREIKEEKDSVDVINGKQGKKTFVFDVSYSERGNKIKIDDIIKATKIPEAIIEKAFATFKKQSEVDFFINKNAEKFLTEQLDMYLHQILLNEENKFEQKRLDQLKIIKSFALKIIKFISQFEDELVRVWNKPKFALNSNYVITIDKLSDEIITKIAKHKNLQGQIKEWQELGMVDEKFTFNDLENNDLLKTKNDKYTFLPIDTKYFKDIELEILSLFDNIDEALDGRLIHSENYQALNTLSEKYKEKVQCIYIDPPYNAPASEIIYANNYKHSSWLTLMDNRIEIAKKLLTEDGVFECAIDKQEQENLGKLLENRFNDYDKTCVSIVHNPRGIQGDNFSYNNEYTYFLAPRKGIINVQSINKEDYEYSQLRKWGGESERNTAKNCFYPIIIKNGKITSAGDVCDENFHPKKIEKNGSEIYIYPIDSNGVERKWRYAKDSFESIKDYLIIEGDVNFDFDIKLPQINASYKTVWVNSKYDAGTYGKKILNQIVPNNGFDFPKSLYNVQDCILAGSQNNSLILDFFPGSGTTAHAIIDLNRNNPESKRKYILTELGNHFNTVILPRIKKVCFSDKWKDGKVQEGQGITQFFKYYKLEQYEDTLRNMKYKDNSPNSIFDNRKAFEQYVFYADQKFAHILGTGKETLEVDFDKLYPNIDFAETISNLLGLPIKKITKTSVVLQDGDSEKEIKTDYKSMNESEKLAFVRLLKPALWWGA